MHGFVKPSHEKQNECYFINTLCVCLFTFLIFMYMFWCLGTGEYMYLLKQETMNI